MPCSSAADGDTAAALADAAGARRRPRGGGDAGDGSAPGVDPEPVGRCLVPRSAPDPRLRLAILAGIFVGALDHRPPLRRARGGPAGAAVDVAFWAVPFGIIGGRIYHVISSPDAYFGPGGDPLGRLHDLGRRPRHLGRDRARRGRRVRSGCAAHGRRFAAVRGRGRAGPPHRPGDRPARQLLQPGALRRADHPAVGPRDRRRRSLPVGLRRPGRSSTRRSSTSCSGTSRPPRSWSGSTGASGSGTAACSGSTSCVYTTGRLWIELLRIDPAELVLGLRINVWTSILVFLGALVAFVLIGRRTPGARPRSGCRVESRSPRSRTSPWRPAGRSATPPRTRPRRHRRSASHGPGRVRPSDRGTGPT